MNPVAAKAIQAGTKANLWLYRRANGRVGSSGTGHLLVLPHRRRPAGTRRASRTARPVDVAGIRSGDRWLSSASRQVPPSWRVSFGTWRRSRRMLAQLILTSGTRQAHRPSMVSGPATPPERVSDPTPAYVLGSSETERQRLVRQAKGFAAEASWLLDQAGVEAGWRAVDVGCGPIGIMDLLCDRVAVTGETVGVDNEARMIAMARDVAAELNLTNLTLVEAQATDTGLQPASFDFAHARLLLVNVPDPERVVAELAALVRPGGVVALQEVDWISWACQPPHPAWDRLRDALREFRRRRGLDVHMGRRLPGMLRAAGLDEVGFRAVCPTYIDGGEDNHTLLVTFAKLHGSALVADGLIAAAELAVLVNELEAHLADPATITLYCLLCQAWARRPSPT
jgi:SAM-dependent methyltransferase